MLTRHARSTASGQGRETSGRVRSATRRLTEVSVWIELYAATSTIPAKVDEAAQAVTRMHNTPTIRCEFIFTKDVPSYTGTALSKDASCIPGVGRHNKIRSKTVKLKRPPLSG
jgi:hypothetical protein